MDPSGVVSALIGAVIGGAIAGWFTLRGVEKAGEDARLVATEEAVRQDLRTRSARRHAWEMEGLAETREVLVAHLSWLERRVLTDPGHVRDALEFDHKTRSNINLVGDPEVIREYSDLIRELSERLPMTRGEAKRARGLQRFEDLDLPMIERTTALRARLLKALDEQELRSMAAQPLRDLTADELASLAGPAAFLDALRERQARESAHDGAPER